MKQLNRHTSTASIYSLIVLCITIIGWPANVMAQEFPEIYNTERDLSEEMMPAEEAAATAIVPEGFQVQVFASEPDVQNPIAATWDNRGRMWVAENYTYSDRAERFDLNLRDRVIILEDSDGDGVSDKRTVFTDQVQMLTSIEVGRGGVWLLCPPQLLFIPDPDLDGKPDGPAQVVLDGFEVAKENYHNFANGLKWGPDGWLYGRCGGSCPGRLGIPGTPAEQRVALEGGIWRYHPVTRECEVLAHGTTNPWGHDWNEDYELFFINTVNGHLWHMIPGAHYTRPFTLDPNPYTYSLIDFHADHWHFDTGKSWTASRDGAADEYGGGHAHVGACIYQGGAWPEQYNGRLFTANMHGRRLNQERLDQEGSGYVGRHEDDFFLSKDPFFRAVEVLTGPDGQMYVIDWSDTGECHEHTGVHRESGRIFRISYQDPDAPANPLAPFNLQDKTDLDLIELQTHENEWWVRQSREVLTTRAEMSKISSEDVKNLLSEFARISNQADLSADQQLRTSVRILHLLHSMDHLDNVLRRMMMLRATDATGRLLGIRFTTDHWPIDDCFGPTYAGTETSAKLQTEIDSGLKDLLKIPVAESDGRVVLALASTLQRLPVDRRIELAKAIVVDERFADDHNLPELVWYGMIPVAETHPNHLVDLIEASTWPELTQWATRRLMNTIDSNESLVDDVVKVAMKADESKRNDILVGISTGLKGWRQAPAPQGWDELSAWGMASDEQTTQNITRELNILFGDGIALDDVKRMVLDNQQDIAVRRSALQALVERKPEGLKEVCLPLLGDARINLIAAKGLAQFDDPEIGKMLVQRYRSFRSPLRPQVISILVSRKSFVPFLLQAVEEGKIDVADITAFDVRQIRSLGDSDLNERVSQLWGEVSETPEETRTRIETLKTKLAEATNDDASLSSGRNLFNEQCSRCHKLYGEGESIGPDLTGANRNNLDYLLENIIAPSAVVSKDYRMSILVLSDGRVLNGLVLASDDKTTTVQTQNEKVVIANDDIEERTLTTESPMPAGILDTLTPEQVKDLIGYLRHPSQVPLN